MPIDFAALLSRNQNLQPCQLAQIVIRDAAKPPETLKGDVSSSNNAKANAKASNKERLVTVYKVDHVTGHVTLVPHQDVENLIQRQLDREQQKQQLQQLKQKAEETGEAMDIDAGDSLREEEKDARATKELEDYFYLVNDNVTDQELKQLFTHNSNVASINSKTRTKPKHVQRKYSSTISGESDETQQSSIPNLMSDTESPMELEQIDMNIDNDDDADGFHMLSLEQAAQQSLLSTIQDFSSSTSRVLVADSNSNNVMDAMQHESLRIGEIQQRQARQANELAYRLSLQTPMCTQLVKEREEVNDNDDPQQLHNHIKDPNRIQEELKATFQDLGGDGSSGSCGRSSDFPISILSQEERIRLEQKRQTEEANIPSQLHEVELGDWQSKINWEGASSTVEETKNTNIAPGSTSSSGDALLKTQNLDPRSLLLQPYNPVLEALDLSSLISWDGSAAPAGQNAKLAQKMSQLHLEHSIAGQSVAKQIGALPHSLPPLVAALRPFNQSKVFRNRLERERDAAGGAGGGTVGALQTDVKQREKEIEIRQRKRAQMAVEKTNRVKNAMKVLHMGDGRGRTITSSLMGPGGTERTGRPSRHYGSNSIAHDAEYVEHLDLVTNHVLVKADLRRGELRYLHRPRLPQRMFSPGDVLPWQFQVKVFPSGHAQGTLFSSDGAISGKGSSNRSLSKTNVGADGSTLIGSYQSSMSHSLPGALSQSKIRNEADLSIAEGSLVLLEYCEEKPPVQLLKGMSAKIVTYYRGDKSKCPISAGGGDRPTRKKKHGDKNEGAEGVARGGSGKVERPPRLGVVGGSNVLDLIGKIPGKKKAADGGSESSPAKSKEPAVTVLPEGITEILHSKDHGPFIGSIKDGLSQTGLICNIFAAPIFRHESNPTDFLMILGKLPLSKQHMVNGSTISSKLGVSLRPMPSSAFCVGQTEPKVKVFAPNSTGEKNFMTHFSVYQIAKALQRKQRGLKFDEIHDGLFPNTEILPNALRQRIKRVAIYDKNTQIWTLKDIAFEGFNGVEELGQKFSPEQVAANWSARAAEQHLRDVGIYELPAMNNIVTNTASAMIYLNGCISAAKKRKQKMSKMAKAQSKSTKSKQALYNKAEMALDSAYKEIKKKGEIAGFIHEELLLAPWNITADFIDVHRKGQGTGMMKLTGLGDPSGQGNAYNFIREVDTKPNKGTGNSDGALKATVKKITGTDNDLRKLSMTQMASILRSYGMDDTEIKNLKRWDRVHVIRDLSTKAASDNAGDGLERFARGEKMKLSDQKRMYRERIQEIWERQRKALADTKGLQDNSRGGGLMSKFSEGSGDDEKAPDAQNEDEKEESSDDEEDDFFEEFENTFKDAEQTNALVKDQLIGDSSEGDMKRGAIYNTAGTELNKEARELASLVRQRQEERDNQFGIDAASKLSVSSNSRLQQSTKGRKVVRRKVTKTYPDGRQTVTFKFIVAPNDVETVISKKEAKEKDEEAKRKKKERKNNKYLNEKSRFSQKAGFQHSLFEGDDEFQTQIKRKTRGGRSRKSDTDYSPPRRKQMGGMGKIEGAKSKQKVSREKIKMKRKREKEEAELYISNARRKGTNNRRERGSAREKPHVIYADKLEQIRQNCEKRPGSGPFHRPVDRSIYPHYYEMISNPIDLQTIRDKIQKYEYKRSDLFIHDFETMRDNAIKFNGVGSAFAKEATSMYDFVKTFIDQNREEFTAMEEAVDDQLNAGKKRNSRASTPNDGMSKALKGKTATVTFDGIATEVNLGNLDGSFFGGGSDSD